jgi:outer membrane protein TolC
MTSIAYRNGTTELLDVREAETQLNQAKLALASEKFNYLSGLLDLEFAINTKLTK